MALFVLLLLAICFLISAYSQQHTAHIIRMTSSVSNPVCVAYNIYDLTDQKQLGNYNKYGIKRMN